MAVNLAVDLRSDVEFEFFCFNVSHVGMDSFWGFDVGVFVLEQH